MRKHTVTGRRKTMVHSSWRGITAWVLVLMGWLVCSTASAGSLQGTATYRERIALGPDAVFEVELQDTSRADAPAVVLGRSRLAPAGQPPFRFEIAYDDGALQPGHRYTIRATIKHQNRLLFTTDRMYPVLDGGNVPLQMVLVSVGGKGGPRKGPIVGNIDDLPASYEGELPGAGSPIAWHVDLLPEGRYQLRTTYIGRPEPNRFDDIGRWTQESGTGRIVLRGGRVAPIFLMPVADGAALRKLDLEGKPIESSHNDRLARLAQAALIEPQLLLTGMFSYMADAAGIKLCVNNHWLPVAMEGDYLALETAYRKANLQPGQSVLVSLEGLIADRPSMEESRLAQMTLVVERFIGIWPRESCGTPLADSPLRGTYWKLVRLDDTPALAATEQREAHLIFVADTLRVDGSGGCNRVTSSFELDGDRLRLGRMASTMMACVDGMPQEKQFLKALEQVESYRIRGSQLELYDATGAVRARFEAVALH